MKNNLITNLFNITRRCKGKTFYNQDVLTELLYQRNQTKLSTIF